MLRCTAPGVFSDDEGHTLSELDHKVDAAGDTWRTLIDPATHATFVSYEPCRSAATEPRR